MDTVLIGMSGGVDSTAAVCLLQKAGYRVEGLTLWLHGSDEGAKSAAAAAAALGIPHAVLDMRAEFEETVKKPFVTAYMEGKTPNPCVLCNMEIKFSSLLSYADAHDIPYIATGHYARLVKENGQMLLAKGQDMKKDQTYFLSRLSPFLLPRLLLPLGAYTKAEVRAVAAGAGLAVAEKADSQEICFIPDGDYISYLEPRLPHAPKEGKILDENGYMVGIHQGIHRYTIGQRKGLGAFGRKVFVTRIDAAENTVTIGENEALFSHGLWAENLNRFADVSGEVEVKIRSAAPSVPALLRMEGERAHITFREAQRAVTPGQTVAIYRGDILLGGGTIIKPIFKEE